MRYRLRDVEAFRRAMWDVTDRDQGHTVRSLAEAAKCSAATVANLRTGRTRTVTAGDARRIAKALGCSRSDLFDPFTFRNNNKEVAPMPETASERSLRMRVASHESWAKTRDRAARTAAARKAAGWTRFENQVKAEAAAAGEDLTEEELRQRTESKRSAFYASMQLKSAQKRRAQMEAKQAKAKAEAEAQRGEAA